MAKTRTWYVIRVGWNAANQSSIGPANPSDNFESHRYALVLIAQAETADQACEKFGGTVYNNQHLFAVSNPRRVRGLTRTIQLQEVSDG